MFKLKFWRKYKLTQIGGTLNLRPESLTELKFPIVHHEFSGKGVKQFLLHEYTFLAYWIGESLDLPMHGKPYLSPQCMDDFRFSVVT